MQSINDPSAKTPEERLAEVASILATAITQLRARPVLSVANSHKSPNYSPACLDARDDSRLTVTTG